MAPIDGRAAAEGLVIDLSKSYSVDRLITLIEWTRPRV